MESLRLLVHTTTEMQCRAETRPLGFYDNLHVKLLSGSLYGLTMYVLRTCCFGFVKLEEERSNICVKQNLN
jgi:hypothetical protein